MISHVIKEAHAEARSAFQALPWDAALGALDPIPPNSLNSSEGLSSPDTESFGGSLEEERQHKLDDYLAQNLLHLITGTAEKQICDQNRSSGYNERDISAAFRLWWQEETNARPFNNPD
jgi:hypothetical protein